MGRILLTLLCLVGSLRLAAGGTTDAVPTEAEVEAMLKKEPISLDTWPTWRQRLLSWSGNHSTSTDAAYQQARAWMKSVATNTQTKPTLPAALINDSYAWYLLARALVDEEDPQRFPRLEPIFRKSITLDKNFANAHCWLAVMLLVQDPNAIQQINPQLGTPPFSKVQEAQHEMAVAKQLDPKSSVMWVPALAALLTKQMNKLEGLFATAYKDDPTNSHMAEMYAQCLAFREKSPRAAAVKEVLAKFPNDHAIICMHAIALAADGDARAGLAEIERCRSLGGKPEKHLPPKILELLAEEGGLSWWEKWLKLMAYFVGFYLIVMAAMLIVGFVLAQITGGKGALKLLNESEDLIEQGHVARTQHESMLAKFYGLGLFFGLILFYLSIPFILIGLIGGTGVLLYLVFQMGRIPIKLIIIIVVIGGGAVIAVIRGLFVRAGKGGFGLQKSAKDCPKLFATLTEVAEKVDTSPVDEVYIAPGSSIGVHQEGRGPFGMFGVKRRVLTLGLSTMRFLTVEELKSILAHEYAHFSHQDTFFSRFIYQVSLTIDSTLTGMAETSGGFIYVNPFFWFLRAYHKSYQILSAGYSRSREFLADRMAATLYGSDVFTTALRKVCTEGSLFETTIYSNIQSLLQEGKAFINMYESFQEYRDKQQEDPEHQKFVRDVLSEKGSFFASHPTFPERIEAIMNFPAARSRDTRSALELFDNAEELEKELTEFLTGYIHYLQELQRQAEQQG